MKIFHSLTLMMTLFAFVFPVCSAEQKVEPGFRIDFAQSVMNGKAPEKWVYKGKPGTPGAVFSIVKHKNGNFLRATSASSSGTIILDISKVDLQKYPVMRWKWKVIVLPENGDGRVAAKDDQAIGIYIGSGNTFSQKSFACRWETVTPKGTAGSAKYAMGMMETHWVCIRNREDKLNRWYVEQCNVYEPLLKLFNGKIPVAGTALSVACNTQYTGTNSAACLEWVEFLPAAAMNEKTE